MAFESLDQEEPPVLPVMVAEEPWVNGDLDRLLVILRPKERDMQFLHYYQGHSAEEIAQTTGQPRGTVLSLIRRAIAKLGEAAAGASGSSIAIFSGKHLIHGQIDIFDSTPVPRRPAK